MKPNTSLARAGMGKKGSFLTDAVKYVEKGVNAVEAKLESDATRIATTSTVFGISIGIVLGIVGTVLMQRYVVAPPPPIAQVPPTLPRV